MQKTQPAPDFPAGEGDAEHRGRLSPEHVIEHISREAQQAMGLAPYDVEEKGVVERESTVLRRANEILRVRGTLSKPYIYGWQCVPGGSLT